MDNNFAKTLESVFDCLLTSSRDERKEKQAENIAKLKEVYNSDKRFLNYIDSALYEFFQMLEIVVDVPKQKNMYILKHIFSGLYEHFFNKLMERIEGSACCADKSRFITRRTLRALKENQNLTLYDDYTKDDDFSNKEYREEQAYWSPKTIKDTDEAMKYFWDWYLIRTNDNNKQ